MELIQDYWTIEQLAKKWECDEDTIYHLIETRSLLAAINVVELPVVMYEMVDFSPEDIQLSFDAGKGLITGAFYINTSLILQLLQDNSVELTLLAYAGNGSFQKGLDRDKYHVRRPPRPDDFVDFQRYRFDKSHAARKSGKEISKVTKEDLFKLEFKEDEDLFHNFYAIGDTSLRWITETRHDSTYSDHRTAECQTDYRDRMKAIYERFLTVCEHIGNKPRMAFALPSTRGVGFFFKNLNDPPMFKFMTISKKIDIKTLLISNNTEHFHIPDFDKLSTAEDHRNLIVKKSDLRILQTDIEEYEHRQEKNKDKLETRERNSYLRTIGTLVKMYIADKGPKFTKGKDNKPNISQLSKAILDYTSTNDINTDGMSESALNKRIKDSIAEIEE